MWVSWDFSANDKFLIFDYGSSNFLDLCLHNEHKIDQRTFLVSEK